MAIGSGWNLWVWVISLGVGDIYGCGWIESMGVGGIYGCGWNLWVWVENMGAVVRRYMYIHFLILRIPTTLVFALF